MLSPHPSRTVRFYCFHLSSRSTLTTKELKQVEIGSPQDVGSWLVDTFKDKLDQHELAEKLKDFICK